MKFYGLLGVIFCMNGVLQYGNCQPCVRNVTVSAKKETFQINPIMGTCKLHIDGGSFTSVTISIKKNDKSIANFSSRNFTGLPYQSTQLQGSECVVIWRTTTNGDQKCNQITAIDWNKMYIEASSGANKFEMDHEGSGMVPTTKPTTTTTPTTATTKTTTTTATRTKTATSDTKTSSTDSQATTFVMRSQSNPPNPTTTFSNSTSSNNTAVHVESAGGLSGGVIAAIVIVILLLIALVVALVLRYKMEAGKGDKPVGNTDVGMENVYAEPRTYEELAAGAGGHINPQYSECGPSSHYGLTSNVAYQSNDHHQMPANGLYAMADGGAYATAGDVKADSHYGMTHNSLYASHANGVSNPTQTHYGMVENSLYQGVDGNQTNLNGNNAVYY